MWRWTIGLSLNRRILFILELARLIVEVTDRSDEQFLFLMDWFETTSGSEGRGKGEQRREGKEPVQFLNLFEHGLDLFELLDDVGILGEVLFAHHFDHESITRRVSEMRREREGEE
jgi:hypothetical protein